MVDQLVAQSIDLEKHKMSLKQAHANVWRARAQCQLMADEVAELRKPVGTIVSETTYRTGLRHVP
eukprot:5456323-Pyramimonas_sp.AAC.1